MVLELLDRGSYGQDLPVEGEVSGLGVGESQAKEGEWFEPPSMVFMEDTTDGGVGGIGGDGQGDVSAGMDEHGGVGKGCLHMVHGSDHLRGDGEVLLGLGQGVRQGAGDVGEAGKESVVKIHHAQ